MLVIVIVVVGVVFIFEYLVISGVSRRGGKYSPIVALNVERPSVTKIDGNTSGIIFKSKFITSETYSGT